MLKVRQPCNRPCRVSNPLSPTYPGRTLQSVYDPQDKERIPLSPLDARSSLRYLIAPSPTCQGRTLQSIYDPHAKKRVPSTATRKVRLAAAVSYHRRFIYNGTRALTQSKLIRPLSPLPIQGGRCKSSTIRTLRSEYLHPLLAKYAPPPLYLITDGSYTKGTRAHTHRELIRPLSPLPI